MFSFAYELNNKYYCLMFLIALGDSRSGDSSSADPSPTIKEEQGDGSGGASASSDSGEGVLQQLSSLSSFNFVLSHFTDSGSTLLIILFSCS